MAFTVFLIIAVVGLIVLELTRSHYRDQQIDVAAKGVKSLQDEVRDLRTRVEILEAIVTDERFELKRELDRIMRGGKCA